METRSAKTETEKHQNNCINVHNYAKDMRRNGGKQKWIDMDNVFLKEMGVILSFIPWKDQNQQQIYPNKCCLCSQILSFGRCGSPYKWHQHLSSINASWVYEPRKMFCSEAYCSWYKISFDTYFCHKNHFSTVHSVLSVSLKLSGGQHVSVQRSSPYNFFTWQYVKRWKEKSKSPHDISGISLYKHGTLLACFGSVYQLTVLPDSPFTVSLRAQSWRAGEKSKRGKTWLHCRCRIYAETPPWGRNKQLLWI